MECTFFAVAKNFVKLKADLSIFAKSLTCLQQEKTNLIDTSRILPARKKRPIEECQSRTRVFLDKGDGSPVKVERSRYSFRISGVSEHLVINNSCLSNSWRCR